MMWVMPCLCIVHWHTEAPGPNSSSWNVAKLEDLFGSINTTLNEREIQQRQWNNKRTSTKEGGKKHHAKYKRRENSCNAGWYHPSSLQLSREALRLTYSDSSELLKEGHRKVMRVSHCELDETKPHRIHRGILGRLLKASLVCRH